MKNKPSFPSTCVGHVLQSTSVEWLSQCPVILKKTRQMEQYR